MLASKVFLQVVDWGILKAVPLDCGHSESIYSFDEQNAKQLKESGKKGEAGMKWNLLLMNVAACIKLESLHRLLRIASSTGL